MSEHRKTPLPYSPGELEAHIRETVGGARADVLVVGSSAIYLAFKDDVRRPNDIDLSVSKDAYPYLRDRLLSQPDWRETPLVDGRPWLTNDLYDISIGWGMPGMSHSSLKQRSRVTQNGLELGSLIDILPWKVHRNEARDQTDNERARALLHSPDRPPLSEAFLAREIAMVHASLPEDLREDPASRIPVHLAANGLFTVFSLYGDPDLHYPGHIVGTMEHFDYNVPALYHNGFGLLKDMHHLIKHLRNINASSEDIFDGIAALTYADSVYGNGRESDAMPGGHDEYLSANLLRSHALSLGYSQERAERLFTIVEQTGFNEVTKAQKGKKHPDPVVRAVCGVDLHSLSDPRADVFDIAIEDIMAARFSPKRVLGKVACEQGIRILSLEEGMAAIDRYGHLKPSDDPNGPTVREAFITRLRGNAAFHESHEYPADWTLDNLAIRKERARRLYAIAQRLEEDPDASVTELHAAL